MKYFFIILISTKIFASDFFNMSDIKKMSFLNDKATYISDIKSVKTFIKENKSVLISFDSLAKSEAKVWWDTIYEGPFFPINSKVHIKIDGLYTFENKVIALLGSISQDAIDISDSKCDYNTNHEYVIYSEACYEGIIYQSLYMDFRGDFIESHLYPEFLGD
ncbi:MAG: hypothetical protein N4A33_00705 [Bacteriovoracaceae bacterium]|jgi:hypothetical protein|nr:hypothetical protein [Bacteriovoracaceae bacterium]